MCTQLQLSGTKKVVQKRLRLRSYVNMNLGWSNFRVATLLLPANYPVMINYIDSLHASHNALTPCNVPDTGYPA